MRNLVLLAASAALLAGCVAATNEDLPLSAYIDAAAAPTYGAVQMSAGSPMTVTVQAGGGVHASVVRSGCTGFIYNVPDYVVNYQTAGNAALTFAVESAADTTLVVQAPDGRWWCSDDDLNLDPLIRINGAAAGRYAIFVGTYESGGLRNATLRVY